MRTCQAQSIEAGELEFWNWLNRNNLQGRTMVWGFRNRNSKRVPLQQAMGRIINRSLSIQELCPELLETGEQRCESRAKRNCPVVIFGSKDSDGNLETSIGFSHDLSMNGVAIFSTQRIPTGETVMAIGDGESRALLSAECISSTPRDFGCFFSTFRLRDLLNPNEHPQFMNCIDQLDRQHSTELVGA